MSDEKQQRIRERAYRLWESEGRPEGRDFEHWVAAEGESEGDDAAAPTQRNEGEGNRTATRAYDKHTREFIESGRVEQQAEDAKKALDGPEREVLEQAERAGKTAQTRRK